MKKKCNVKKIKQFIKNNKIYIILFLFIYCISCCLPLTGDDWGNYQNISLYDSFRRAYLGYMSHESRWVSRVLITQLVYHKWLWNILNAFCFTSIFWSIIKLFDLQNKFSKMLFAISMVIIPCAMFAQVYAWVVGSITYLFPVAIILLYMTYLFKLGKIITRKNLLFIILTNFLTSFFVDHMAVVLFFINLIYFVFLKINKEKITVYNYIVILVSILSITGVLFAPGNLNRLATNSEFESLSIIGKILFNIPNLINYTFYANLVLLFLMTIPINYFFINILKRNYGIKYILTTVFNIIPIYTIIKLSYQYNIFSNLESAISFDFYFEEANFILNHNIGYIFYIIFALTYFISLLYIIKDKKKKNNYIILLLIGLSANGAMLISPIWGYRTAFFTTIILYGLTIAIINHIMNELKYCGKDLNLILKVILISLILFYSACFVLIARFDQNRISNISLQYKSKNVSPNNIYLKILPLKIVHNYNMYWEFHQETYKDYLFHAGIINDVNININILPLQSIKGIYMYEE
ncbi:MAG: DUF6056 family protein [Bacilli bacterium]|nr:DUF6056 family protein [Bacilli bacterium]